MQRPFRSYGPPRRRRSTIVVGVFLASMAVLAARLPKNTEPPPTPHEILSGIEATQVAEHGPRSVKVTIQSGADVTEEDVQRCQASGRIVVVRLAEMSETSMPRASCVDAKHLEALPSLPWVTLTP